VAQHAAVPGAAFQGPRLERTDFVSFDGARLPLRRWAPKGEPWAVIVGLHGMNDYANAFHLAGPRWAKQGIATYAYDQRGFGRTAHRGIWAGGALMQEDLRTLTGLVRERYPHAVIAVAGISIGGAVAIEAFASDRPPAADRLVLLAPAVWGWATQPPSQQIALWIAAHSVLRGVVLTLPKSWITKYLATDNLPELRRMSEDPNIILGARPDALYGAMNTMQRAWWSMGRVGVPTFYAYGFKDRIVPKRPSAAAASRLRADFRSAYYKNGHHLLLVDLERDKVIGDVAAFIRDPAAPLPSGAPPIPPPRGVLPDSPR
jgi:alpha-beta hydrolase superfamily lysophospholipase